jgi:Ca2+-binding EF-hand superfamily protein
MRNKFIMLFGLWLTFLVPTQGWAQAAANVLERDPGQSVEIIDPEEWFLELDQNGDGLLDYDEMPEELRAERNLWDTNHDGFISLDEFKAYCEARARTLAETAAEAQQSVSGTPVVRSPVLAQMIPGRSTRNRPVRLLAGIPAWFSQLDRNGDGQISLHEWNNRGWPLEEFERIDRNGDGFLSQQEVLSYLRRSPGAFILPNRARVLPGR